MGSVALHSPQADGTGGASAYRTVPVLPARSSQIIQFVH
jgi:hypothetical protein